MIRFTVQIGMPGYLDGEDELSNLLQGEGEEQELRWDLKEAIWSWCARWMPHISFSAIRIEIAQE